MVDFTLWSYIRVVRVFSESVGLIILMTWNSVMTIAVVAMMVFMCKMKSSMTKAYPTDEEEEPEYETEKKM